MTTVYYIEQNTAYPRKRVAFFNLESATGVKLGFGEAGEPGFPWDSNDAVRAAFSVLKHATTIPLAIVAVMP